VLMLTAKGQLEDRVRGLDVGRAMPYCFLKAV